MKHELLQDQIKKNVEYVASDKFIVHNGVNVPYMPAGVPRESKLNDEGGGVIQDYSWRVKCVLSHFASEPVEGDVVTAHGLTYIIGRVEFFEHTNEVSLSFENPDD